MNETLNILISPLEWGLGHATRVIPIAKRLKEMNHNIFIASGDTHFALLNSEIPGLSFIRFPGFKPKYSRQFPQYFALLFKIPLLIYHITREHYVLKKIVRKYRIDLVISDNRFGMWNKKVRSIYITHLPLIPLPEYLKFMEFTGKIIHRAIIKRYTYCLIPDLPGEINLSGRLSHNINLLGNVRYIGLLSRFSNEQYSSSDNPKRYNTVILSGPEPQKEMLKQKIISIFKTREPSTIVFEGKPEKSVKPVRIGNITFYSHLPTSAMKEIIKGSENIITRSGYSTIMDLISLKQTALLIPTPGQTEQEYLAKYLSSKGWFGFIRQKELNEEIVFPQKTAPETDEIIKESRVLFDKVLNEILYKPH